MTDPVLQLEPTRVSVQPGAQVSVVCTIFNPTDNVVEGYDVDVVAAVPVPWVEVQPPHVAVYPGDEVTVLIVFSPPAGPGTPGGSIPFGVRVQSEEQGGGSAVVEGDLDIGSVQGLSAKLTPTTSSGRWSGRHTLAVFNGGNNPARLRLVPESPDQGLGFMISPPVIDVPPGAPATARLKVRTRHPTLRGAPRALPFTVACEPDQGGQPMTPLHPAMSTAERPVENGSFQQKPILTRGVVVLAGLVAVAAIAGIAYLLTSGGDTGGDEADREVLPADTPTNFSVDGSQTGFVTLTWAPQPEVDGYHLVMTKPSTDEQDFTITEPPLTLPIESAGTYCYRLQAVRQDADLSAPSEEACAEATVPPTAPTPTGDPTIVAPPGSTEPPTGESLSPTTATTSPGSPGTGVATPVDQPASFILPIDRVVPFGFPDPAGEAERVRQSYLAAGVPAELMNSELFTFTPQLAEQAYLIYLDGDTSEQAETACQAMQTSHPDVVHCGSVIYQVAPR